MSTRKVPADADLSSRAAAPVQRARKKARVSRVSRVHLTHLEVRHGDTLRLRIAVADDAMAEVGDELGALIKKIAPGTRTSVVEAPQPVLQAEPQPDFIIARQHTGDDATYHAHLREHLTGLFSSLCDAALADALEIAREERDRRAEGGN
jgi:hypothetical protein